MEDDEVSLLGDLEDELDDPLDGEGGEVRAEFEVVAHRTDEDGQPAVETVILLLQYYCVDVIMIIARY